MDTSTPPATKDRYTVEWAPHGAIKRVTITRLDTGRQFVGSDWASWDIAYQEALQQAVTRRLG